MKITRLSRLSNQRYGPQDLRRHTNCVILEVSRYTYSLAPQPPSVTQLPSPHRYPTDLQHGKRLRPKTYTVAVYLVGAVILLQVVMFILVFWLRAMVVSVNVNLPNALGTAPGNPNPANPVTPNPNGNTDNPGIPRLPGLEMTVSASRACCGYRAASVPTRWTQIGNPQRRGAGLSCASTRFESARGNP